MRVLCALLVVVVLPACSSAPAGITEPVDAGVLRVNSEVLLLRFARTEHTAIALTADQKLRLLSLPDGKELHTIDWRDRPVNAFDASPDGSTVALGDRTGLVSVWEAATGRLRFEHKLPKYPGVLAFSHDGRKLAIVAADGAARILDAATGAEMVSLASQVGGTPALAFSPDGRWIATGDGDTIVRIHDAATGKEVAQNNEFLMVPLAVTFTADSKSVIAVSGDKVVTTIDAATGKTTRKFDRTAQPVWSLDVSPDGKLLATSARKAEDITKPARIVLHAFDSEEPRIDWLPPAMPIGSGWTKDGQLLVAFTAPEGVRLWRLH